MKCNDAARNSGGTEKIQGPWGGAKACTHGPFSLPALVGIPPANSLAYALILINALSGVFALLGV